MNRITTEYKKFQGDIATISRCVIDNMENNEAFPDPPEALAELKRILPEFENALADARSRDMKLVSIKNDIKAIVLDLLQELADYVTLASKGDRTKMLSSGFNVSSENGINKEPPAIEKLEVAVDISGMAITRVKNVTNTIAFIHQYTTESPGPHTLWVSQGSSLSSYTFQGLQPEKRYWFRVVAIGYYGLTGYSPVISRFIQ